MDRERFAWGGVKDLPMFDKYSGEGFIKPMSELLGELIKGKPILAVLVRVEALIVFLDQAEQIKLRVGGKLDWKR